MSKLEEAETSRFKLLYHMRNALSLLRGGNVAEATITLNAAIAISDEEDRIAIAQASKTTERAAK